MIAWTAVHSHPLLGAEHTPRPRDFGPGCVTYFAHWNADGGDRVPTPSQGLGASQASLMLLHSCHHHEHVLRVAAGPRMAGPAQGGLNPAHSLEPSQAAHSRQQSPHPIHRPTNKKKNACFCKPLNLGVLCYTVVPPFPQGIWKTPGVCLKPQRVPNPIHTMLFPGHTPFPLGNSLLLLGGTADSPASLLHVGP